MRLWQELKGGPSLWMAALFLCLSASLGAASLSLLEARVAVFKPACSRADLDDVQAAIAGASALLQAHCGFRLLSGTPQVMDLRSEWCRLPDESEARRRALQRLAAQAKAQNPRDLALFLLPSQVDRRLSWALVDQSLKAACDSPQEARFLGRFGSFFFTDLTWMQGPSPAAILVAHEVLHALTHRRHPTQSEPGSVMADHLADMGPKINADWCACARRSPYLRKP